MPRKDPISGCNVMTSAEFYEVLGRAEGISGAEAKAQHDAQIEEERIAEEQRLLADPRGLFDWIWSACYQGAACDLDFPEDYRPNTIQDEDGEEQPWLVEVQSLLNAEVVDGVNGSSVQVEGTGVFSDGTSYLFRFLHWSDSGSFYEPPTHSCHLRLLSQVQEPAGSW